MRKLRGSAPKRQQNQAGFFPRKSMSFRAPKFHMSTRTAATILESISFSESPSTIRHMSDSLMPTPAIPTRVNKKNSTVFCFSSVRLQAVNTHTSLMT